ncbi:MAG: hypothetical protein AB1486_06225 [Planctomycetota bacterium]
MHLVDIQWPARGAGLLVGALMVRRSHQRLQHPCYFMKREVKASVKAEVVDAKKPIGLLVGLGYDDRGSMAAGTVSGRIMVQNVKTGRSRSPNPKTEHVLMLGKTYAIILEHKGSEDILTVDGKEEMRVPDEGVTGGRPCIISFGEANFEVADIVVRGTLDPTFVATARERYVSERRAKWEKAEGE